MNFEEYLKGKKIDPHKFKESELELWNEFEGIFKEMHPKSFTLQKLFLINAIRLKYPYIEVAPPVEGERKKAVKPIIRTGKPAMGKPIMKRPKIK
ncbi:MAG TPA: hypothetical protein PKL31_06845 [Fulvivirga sp.]|nr:hypothetical protein [Fulvivirga sp.]